MPRICDDFYGISVIINFEDHNPPHFHAFYSGEEILIDIKNLTIYAGYFPGRALALVMEWATIHQKELIEAWDSISNHIMPAKIAPLP